MQKPKKFSRTIPVSKPSFATDSKERQDRRAFYHSPAWRKLRAVMKTQAIESQLRNAPHEYTYHKVLASGNPLCEACLRVDKATAARVLDHIKPISQGGASLDPTNLQWLCDHHHNIKSGSERTGRGG